jgi:class 3 adenylate cyclase/predicted ATPase
MQQIADWLEKLGMSEYAERFAENKIDVSVLRHLTDQDLKDIGVALGHRRKILAAIAEFAAATATEPKFFEPEPKPQDTAERRQITVMFSDLVGSTALSARMDPEDLREIISAYQKCVAETVQRFGGFVAKYMGDGVLVYFGYPQAHEDDAERAVLAGLELIQAVGALKSSAPQQTRVGIATGLVVVGDLIGTGSAQEQAVVGETPNLAARLQGIAEPNTVVIAESTRKLLGDFFDLEDLGAKNLKGIAEPVRSWAALRASGVESRFEALRTATTPLVGRDEEIELLMRRWTQAKAGDGSVVLISGEPGIGKSRITEAVQERLSTEPHTRLRFFCSPHHQDSALYPAIAQLERAAGFRRDDTSEQRLEKLEAVLSQATKDISEIAPLLADLLSIPTGSRYPTVDLTPQKRKEKTLEALVAHVDGLSARESVLIVFEDVHWSDPTTRELLDLLIDRVPTMRALATITFRPEFTPTWIGRPHVTLMSLNRLSPRHRAALITGVTGGKALPKEIADQIIDRTDGVPLFIEELTKSVVESGILTKAGDHYSVAGPTALLAIPTTLQASLLARLDRLASTREVAQIGAALGRSFSHEVISAVAPTPQQRVDDALEQLVNAELIFRRGTPPDAEYTFKHALVQDAAYGTLLRSRRQQLHARIASTLESQFPDVVETQPELLGRHFGEGGFEEKAIAYFTIAGERAVKRGANAEVIRHFHRALELLQGRPETAERSKAELKVLEKLGPALQAAHGFGAPEVERTYLRARDLCEQLGEPVELFRALWGLWVNTFGRERFEAARPIADDLIAVAHQLDDRALLLEAHHAMCPTTLWVGNPQATRSHGEQGMRLYEREQHRSLAFLFGGHDPGVCCRMHSGMALWFLGHPDSALERSRTGLEMARELSHIGTIVNELPFGGIINQLCGDVVAVHEIAESLTSLSTEHGFPQWLAFGNILHAWVQARSRGETAQLRRAISEYRAANELYVPYFLGLLAAIQLTYDELAEGLDTVVSALELTGGRGSRLMDPELLRLKGELLIALDPGARGDAEVAFCQAIDIAQRQNSKSWELRAAMSMARLWRDQGKRDEARELLAPVYGWFTEGFDTLDLKEAKALLDELAS